VRAMRVHTRCSLFFTLGLVALSLLVVVANPCPIAAADGGAASMRLPSGWRLPTPNETMQDWRKDFVNNALLVRADFDGDGVMDEARLVVRDDGGAVAVAVSLGRGAGIYLLGEIHEAGWLEVMGIVVVKPGKYKTACGKGYFDCQQGEATRLTLPRPGVNFFKEGGANSFLYWQAGSRQFKQTWMSD
jgi:hypothetical protein